MKTGAPGEVDIEKSGSPLYTAVTLYCPLASAVVVKLATPLVSGAEPRAVALPAWKNETEPLG
jgi:hypothetical protein